MRTASRLARRRTTVGSQHETCSADATATLADRLPYWQRGPLDGEPAALNFVHAGFAPGTKSLIQGHAALGIVHAGFASCTACNEMEGMWHSISCMQDLLRAPNP